MTTETIEDTDNLTCYDTSATELRELVFVIVHFLVWQSGQVFGAFPCYK